LNAREDAWHGDREGVVDLERTEDEKAPAPPAADLVGDDLAGLEARDRTERPLLEVGRGAEEELGSRPLVAWQRAELHGRLHRSLRSDGPRGPRTIASMPVGGRVVEKVNVALEPMQFVVVHGMRLRGGLRGLEELAGRESRALAPRPGCPGPRRE
jgi:hypothetical protein